MQDLALSQFIHPDTTTAVRHGGDLATAMLRFGGSQKDWLDLSTGISPWAYPAPEITVSEWRQLPPDQESLIQAAANYYDCSPAALTVCPGSQLPIRLIPALITNVQTVAIPKMGYQEHFYAWHHAGHQVIFYRDAEELGALITAHQVQNAVVINPNNPSGEIIDSEQLKLFAGRLAGILLVDEAFADYGKYNSLCGESTLNNIIVLRSMGKFFGMAGARVGFIVGQHLITEQLSSLLSHWSINAPAQRIAELALKDVNWQQQQSDRIYQQAANLDSLLGELSTLQNSSSCNTKPRHHTHGLFSTLFCDNEFISHLHRALAERKIWTRIGDPDENQNWLRMSLPGDHLGILSKALNDIGHL